jgi:hypothetical protein
MPTFTGALPGAPALSDLNPPAQLAAAHHRQVVQLERTDEETRRISSRQYGQNVCLHELNSSCVRGCQLGGHRFRARSNRRLMG